MSYLAKRTSYWDYLPPEIQVYIMMLADRSHHRDRLGAVHQVLQHFWDICRCGPFHLLREIKWCTKWKIANGIRAFLRSQNQVVFKKTLRCRRLPKSTYDALPNYRKTTSSF